MNSNYRIQHAFDGFYYPQIRDGEDYEYLWNGSGEEVRFATEDEAQAYILNLQGVPA